MAMAVNSERKPVCKACYKDLEDQLRNGCNHSGQSKVTVAASPCGSVFLRSNVRSCRSLPGHYYGAYRVCRYKRNCYRGQSCSFAHCEEECVVWNVGKGLSGICHQMCLKCVKEFLEKVKKLQMAICRSNHMSKNGFIDSFLWTKEVTDQHVQEANLHLVSIVRPIPNNVAMMRQRGFQYKFRHSYYNCRFQHQGCYHPHGEEEDQQWNAWKFSTEEWTPLKLHDSAVANYQRSQIESAAKEQEKEQEKRKIAAKIHSQYRIKGEPVDISKLRELKVSNYRDWFHSLLCLEEESIQEELQTKHRSRCVKDVKRVDDRTYTLTVRMANEDAQFLCTHAHSFKVKLTLLQSQLVKSCTAEPVEAIEEGLVVKCHFVTKITQLSFQQLQLVRCHLKSWDKKHRTVEKLPEIILQRLLPEFIDFASKQSPRIKNDDYEREVVSKEKILKLDQIFQQKAADVIMSSPPGPPFLLTGPFGTGKTRLIARLAHQILHTISDSKVLISVHHNQTADTYPWNFFAELKEYPLPCVVYRLLPDVKEPLNPRIIHNVLACSARQMIDHNRSKSFCLVVTTNETALRLMDNVNLDPGYFTHIFIDEAAQCIEPEALMPLLLAGPNTKVILAGDHLQVGPEDAVQSPKARQYGFTRSLLTRLHERYTKLGTEMIPGGGSGKKMPESPLVRQFTANLLTNYRCDANILRLPSNLFYECSLLARAQHELHPSTNSSLVFVCTSLAAPSAASSYSAAQPIEVGRMLDVATKFLDQWPEQWDEYGKKGSVCFMARTPQQLSTMRSLIKRGSSLDTKIKSHEVQLRTTYSIQGQEYTVVFLLTTEPHDVVKEKVILQHQSLGASLVNKRVFNTVLTRARTLFVAIGNPMYLLQVESSAPDGGLCWKEYLRRCIESSSIQLPKNCTNAQRQALLRAAFDDHDPLGRSCGSHVEDTILDTYSWEFLRKLDFVGGSWRIPKLVDEDSDDEEECSSINCKLAQVSLNSWTLQCTSAHQARAIPELPGGREFAIEGLKSRGQALDGARVVVKALGDSLGKVVSVVKQSPIRLFLCRMDTFNSNLFVPLNGKGPKLANLPAVSRKLIQIDKAVDEFEDRQKGHLVYKKYPIACYDLSGLEKDPPVPKLRDLIPQEIAKNLVFIVRFIEWKGDSGYPMAAVVGTFPIAHTEFHGNRLIQAMNKGPSQESEVEEMKKSMKVARQCFKSSQFHPKAVVTKAEGKSFFIKLEGNPCKALEVNQPAFRVGCDRSTERLVVSWRFKMCSTKEPEVVLQSLSKMIVFKDNSLDPLSQRRDLIHITLVVTDMSSKKSEVVKGWTDPNANMHTTQELPNSLLRRFAGKHISLYSFSIKCSVTEGQVLPVWVGANTGGLVIQPEVQLVRPAPYLDLCMQHSTRPAQCFSSPVLHNASIERYKDVNEYIELWESALLAEAAESSVKDGELLFVDQATLCWDEYCFKGVTDLLKEPSFVYEGEVTLWLDKDFVTRSGRFVQFNTGDFVCARYEVSPEVSGSVKVPIARAVYHFVVQSFQILENEQGQCKKGDVLVQMKMVGERNAVISSTMRHLVNKKPYTLQIIPCMTPQRRMYESLLQLTDASDFAQKVLACGHVNLVNPTQLRAKLAASGNPEAFLASHPLSTRLWGSSKETSNLNPKQKEAIKKALKYKFTLIQGPPGTGKSVTGVHLAYAFYKCNRQEGRTRCVLYCAPSNKATDVVLGYLHQFKMNHKSPVKILRIYSRGMEYQTKGAGPRMNEEIFKQIITDKCPKEFLPYALHDKVSRTQYGTEIESWETKFQDMKARGQIPSAEEEKRYHYCLSAGEREVFDKEKFDIILCTCNEAASLRMKQHLRVQQCIVDECGYAVEPDAMIPLQLSQHVVLIGDHKQLQPVIKNSIAGDNGLNRSLFERYADMYTKAKEKTRVAEEACAFTQLEEQYRMHEAICQPPSDLFYNKTLKTAYSVSIGWREYRGRFRSAFRSPFPSSETPLLFCNVVGRERSPQSSTTQGGGPESKQNWDEADVVVKLVQEFKRGLTPLPPNSNVDDIVVLTPYRGQKDCINRKLENIGCDSVPVKTVNESQGSEANIVILSTVRSMSPGEFDPELLRGDIGWAREHLGFITDPHQICVAISRSKFGFIVVGNGRLLSCDHTWNKIINNHFKRNGCFVERYS